MNEFARDAAAPAKGAKNATNPKTEAWASFCQVLLASAEFRYLN